MADDLNYFVFTVTSADEDPEDYLPSDARLDGLNAAIPQIISTLGGDSEAGEQARLASNPNNLILKKFFIYAGSGLNSEFLPGEGLPSPDDLPPGGRYGRPIFVGLAAGKDIFTPEALHTPNLMKIDQQRFNCFLDEIFGISVEVERDDGTREIIPYKEIEDYDGCENRPSHPEFTPWSGGWTIVRVASDYDFENSVGPGHNC
jgi:hypothetical protein